MRSCLGRVGCVLAIFLFSVGASAEDEARNDVSGPYVSLGLSGLIATWDANEPGLEPEETASFGVTARAGYRFNGWLAAEGHYEYMDGQEVKGALQTGELRAHILTFNTKWSLPIEGDTRPYAILGIGAVEYSIHNPIAGTSIGGSEWDFSGRLGAGIESYLTDHVVFFLEASAIASEKKLLSEHFPLVSVGGGLLYKF